MNYLASLFNPIHYVFNEVKNFIVLIDKIYNSNHYDDDDNGHNDDISYESIHSYYTIANFFDVMGIYKDNEIQKVNVDVIDYIYNSVSKFFNDVFNLIYINFFVDNNVISKDNSVCEIKKIYDNKYDDKYDGLESIYLTEDDIGMLSNKYVMEYTPVGNVVMYFDYDKKAFQYYSDFSVPYKYLECVSKKFCIMNKNKIYREIKMDVDVNEFSIVRNSSSSLQNKSKSFAKLKGYNNSNPSVKNDASNQGVLKIIQKDIVRYTHLGKLCNFSFIKNTIPKFKPVSYKDFLKKHSLSEGWVL
jgi:hypothetical protein